VRSDVAVLFDLDGVIVDSRVFHMEAWERWALEHAIAHEPGYFRQMFGRGNDAIIGGLRPGVSPEDLLPLAEHKEALFRDAARGRMEALPGVLDLLAFLQEHDIPRAIVTSTPQANLDMILEDLGLVARFQALVAEEDAAKGKPDPEGFLACGRSGRRRTRPVHRHRGRSGRPPRRQSRRHAGHRRHHHPRRRRPLRRRPRRGHTCRSDGPGLCRLAH
jgi:beta-phosphoglucomutase-like phosphatase (HAD superfamily)